MTQASTPRAKHAPTLEQALKAAQATRALEIGPGVVKKVPEVFKNQFGDRTALVICDKNTWAAGGEIVIEALQSAKLPVRESFIFSATDLYAEYRFVEQLEAALKSHQAIPIAVGSGTINDLTKLAAHKTDRPYMSVATAASMDGYTAFGASITFEGSKQTFNCPAPTAVVADLDIICAAPGDMNAWGYADLLAKVTAGADWIIADELKVEPIDTQAWSIVQSRLREMVSDPAGIHDRRPKAIGGLVEGLMLGGFAMQATRSSRPASGAEHQFSHLWDMQHHIHNGSAPSHGFKVGIATLAITAFYEQLLNEPLDKIDVDACCARWPDENEWINRVKKLFDGTDVEAVASKEIIAKYDPPQKLREQLLILRANWPTLANRLRQQLIPFKQLREMLLAAGAPVEPEQIGISRERLRDTFRQAFNVRRRFTVLDLAMRTGTMERCLDHLFGANGPWPVAKS